MVKRMKTAIYCRVSTEEQAKYGYSIDTQKQILTEFAEKNGLEIIDYYLDGGFSGSTKKRPELTRLLEDIRNKRVKLIIFTRLDRWVRSVALYYKLQEELEEYGCEWKTTEEDYDTTTATGKLAINIWLSISQQYRDTTSEKVRESLRIKTKNGYYPSGSVPFGFMLKKEKGGSRLVQDPEKSHIVKDMIDTFMASHSINGTHKKIMDRYGISITYNSFHNLLTNPILHGEYNGYKDFCEPYISEAAHKELIDTINTKNIKTNSKHDYIFRGLLVCPVCGNTLKGTLHINNRPYGRYNYYAYRCAKHYVNKSCSYKSRKYENATEKEVLKQLRPQFEEYLVHIESARKKAKIKPQSIEKLKAEQSRLNNMYLKGRIEEKDYDLQYAEIEKRLNALVTPLEPHTEKISNVLDTNLTEFYSSLNGAEKGIFWQSILKRIEINTDGTLRLIFLT